MSSNECSLMARCALDGSPAFGKGNREEQNGRKRNQLKKGKSMKRTLTYLTVAAGCITMGATLIYAASVHFKGDQDIIDTGTSLTFCGALAGLGNEDVTITVTTEGLASANCINAGGNMAPGRNKIPVVSSVSQTISRNEIKNGNVSFCASTPSPGPVSARAAGCPNNNWEARIIDVEFESATVTVMQGGQVVLEQTFE